MKDSWSSHISVSMFNVLQFLTFHIKINCFVSCCPKQSDCRQFGRPSHWKGLSRSLRSGSLYTGRRWRSYAGWAQRGAKDVGILFFPPANTVLYNLNAVKTKCFRSMLHIPVFYFHFHLNSVTFRLHVKVLPFLFWQQVPCFSFFL